MPDQKHVTPDAAEVPGEEQAEPVLPEAVRQRVIALAAAAITGMPADEVPGPLRRVAGFAPNRRARLGGSLIAAQLATDPLFRQLVGSVRQYATARRRRPRVPGRGPPWRTSVAQMGGRRWSLARSRPSGWTRRTPRARSAWRRPSTGPREPSTSVRWPRWRRRRRVTSSTGCVPRRTPCVSRSDR